MSAKRALLDGNQYLKNIVLLTNDFNKDEKYQLIFYIPRARYKEEIKWPRIDVSAIPRYTPEEEIAIQAINMAFDDAHPNLAPAKTQEEWHNRNDTQDIKIGNHGEFWAGVVRFPRSEKGLSQMKKFLGELQILDILSEPEVISVCKELELMDTPKLGSKKGILAYE